MEAWGIVDFIGGNECQVAQIDADTLVLNMRVQASQKIFNRVVAVSKRRWRILDTGV
ncbi:MAG: hypothetical protein ACLUKN_15515 [Bacilli bacterium]